MQACAYKWLCEAFGLTLTRIMKNTEKEWPSNHVPLTNKQTKNDTKPRGAETAALFWDSTPDLFPL